MCSARGIKRLRTSGVARGCLDAFLPHCADDVHIQLIAVGTMAFLQSRRTTLGPVGPTPITFACGWDQQFGRVPGESVLPRSPRLVARCLSGP